jgi:hypothetical protein
MDFLKQNNFRYIVIIIIIILAVINLCKINSQENFIVLDEEQDLGTHTVKINSTDQVMFGDKTLTHKLTNIESGRLVLGTLHTAVSILDGVDGLHLRSNRDVYLMSPPGSVTRVATAWGNSGKLVVEGSAHFRSGAFVEGEFHSTTNSPEGGRISLMNPSKSATGEVSNWTIYNMTGGYKPNGLHFWKYPTDAWKDSGSTFVLTDDGNTLVKGNLDVAGNITCKTITTGPSGIYSGGRVHIHSTEDYIYLLSKSGTIIGKEWGGPAYLQVQGRLDVFEGIFTNSVFRTSIHTNEGGQIQIFNPSKTSYKNLVNNWTIFNMTDVNDSPHKYTNGLHFWRYGGEGDKFKNYGPSFVLTDDGNTLVNGNLNVVATTFFKGELNIHETIRKTRENNKSLNIVSDKTLYLMAKENVHIFKCIPKNCERWDGASGNLIVDGDLGVAGNFSNASDRRLKENIKNISQNDKDKVLQLVPKTYNMISDQNKKRYGLIAQEVEELYPELVNTNETDGMKSMNYIELIPLLLEQIKELKKSVPNQNIINIDGVTLNKNELSKLKQLINM